MRNFDFGSLSWAVPMTDDFVPLRMQVQGQSCVFSATRLKRVPVVTIERDFVFYP